MGKRLQDLRKRAAEEHPLCSECGKPVAGFADEFIVWDKKQAEAR